MVMIIDFLETSDRASAAQTWDTVSIFLSQQPGFRAGQLVETFDTLLPRGNYQFASFCEWDTAEQWDEARDAAKRTPDILGVLKASSTKFTSFKMALVDGRPYAFRLPSDHMVLVDIIYLPENRMSGYAAMWSEAAAYLSGRPGYVNAGLYRNLRATDEVKYIHHVEWQNAATFFDAVHTPRFLEIVEPFKENFSRLLNTRRLLRFANVPQMSPQGAGV